MNKIKVAILGATSHIAKGLVNNFLDHKGYSLYLYTRSPGKARAFLDSLGGWSANDCEIHDGYKNFSGYSYDVIINCVGAGTLNKLKGNYRAFFTVTEEYDNLVINYLQDNHIDTLYISFSSGAVYGRGLSSPALENTANSINVNHVKREDYYGIVRLNAEAKHRAFNDLRIVDLRLFSYFSRFIDLSDGYFITDVLDCILKNKTLLTDEANIVRDYVNPDDLFSAIIKCANAGKINAAFDIASAKSIKKKEILDYFFSEYGLKYEISKSLNYSSGTGFKNIYYSEYNKSIEIGYRPKFSSIDTIKQESDYILFKRKGHARKANV